MSRIVSYSLSRGGFGLLLSLAVPIQAHAQTPLQQCSADYQAAKAANQLNGLSWNQFRAQCPRLQLAQANPLKPAAANPSPPPTQPVVTSPAKPAAKPTASPVTTNAAAQAAPAGAAPAGNAVFPKAVDPKYANEKPGKQRQKTCLDQYNANKATNSNGGLKWIAKDGYYSQCTNRLKT